MKKITLALLLSLSAVVLAGDDYIQTVAYTGTAACSTILKPKAKTAVRCTTDCYVRASTTGTASNTATAVDVLLSAGKLYDFPTTYNQQYICFLRSSADGSAYIYLNRGPLE